MTYERIFELKFRKGYSTGQLLRRFPKEATKVQQIALLEIPTTILKKTVEADLLERILSLKRRFFRRLH